MTFDWFTLLATRYSLPATRYSLTLTLNLNRGAERAAPFVLRRLVSWHLFLFYRRLPKLCWIQLGLRRISRIATTITPLGAIS